MRFSKEEEYLRQKDKKLKKIIDGNGHIYFKPDKKNQFDTLVGIVVFWVILFAIYRLFQYFKLL